MIDVSGEFLSYLNNIHIVIEWMDVTFGTLFYLRWVFVLELI